MHAESKSLTAVDFGVLRAHGADVSSFLQGQLSNDVARLQPALALLAGYHNPQGRTLALLRLLQLAGDDVLMILPRELLAPLASRLAKYILRARVKLSDGAADWRITPLVCAAPDATPLPAAEAGAVTRYGAARAVCVGAQPARWLWVAPHTDSAPLPAGGAAADRQEWLRLEIAAGLPEVYAASSEVFLAQMLNLDVLGALAFDKGCYTGQEVIARAHYRGRVKRRMQRFLSRHALSLAPGDAGRFEDGRAFRVVRAATTAAGRCEFLAVTTLAGAETAQAADDAAPAAAHGERPLAAEALPLPYALPE